MKKYLFLLVCGIIVMGVFFAGCVTENSDSHKVEITVEDDYFIDYIIDYDTGYVSSPDENCIFYIINLTVKNIGTESVNTASSYITIVDKDNNTYSVSTAIYWIDNSFSMVKVHPGNQNNGKLVFEIPDYAIPDKLYYEDFYNELTVDL